MHPLIDEIRAHRVEAAKRFAARFNQLEWKYLCSYQWFLTGVSEALDSGNFFPIQARAEEALVDGRIRKPPLVLTIDAVTPSQWFGYL
jgi:hypothetical protein